MATSRPIRRGEWLTCIQGHCIGMSRRAVGDENPVEYVRQEDFAIQDLFGQRCAQEACVRIFGVTWPPSEDTYQAAITNGTAPGLYVREGDDTSNWEVYREVLARRVDEAMATRSGVETTATVRRFGPGPRKCSTNGLFIGVTAPYHIEWSGTAMFYMYSDGRREQTETTLEHCLNGVRSGSYVELPVGLRTVEARVGETAAPPQPTPTSPSRFSLLEVDADAGSEAASPPQARKASVDLGALQAELRAEREAKRALAAAQTPPGRFNLLECDLPAVATAVPKRPVVSSPSPKPLSPVETITDLTAARSPLELARMLAGLDEELSTMMRQREAN